MDLSEKEEILKGIAMFAMPRPYKLSQDGGVYYYWIVRVAQPVDEEGASRIPQEVGVAVDGVCRRAASEGQITESSAAKYNASMFVFERVYWVIQLTLPEPSKDPAMLSLSLPGTALQVLDSYVRIVDIQGIPRPYWSLLVGEGRGG